MRKFIQVSAAAALSALLVVIVIANAQPGAGFSRSADFAGTGSSGSPMEMSTNVTMPGIASVAGASAGSSSPTLTVSATSNGVYSNSVLLKASSALGGDSSTVRFAKSDGTLRWSMGNNSANGTTIHDFWIYDNTNLNYMLYADPALVSSLRFGLSEGRLRYTDSTHTWTFLTNGTTRLTLADALITGAVASQWNDDATFESGTCVINSLGITCDGTLMTPGADITAVNTTAPIAGGAASGAVTISLTPCSNGEGYLVSAGVWTCTALAPASSISGLTTNTIPKAASATSLTNSTITDDGTTISVGSSNFRVTAVSGNTSGGSYQVNNTTGGMLRDTAVSGTNPTFVPLKSNVNTGIGSQASGNLSLIAGGVEIVRVTSTGTTTTGEALANSFRVGSVFDSTAAVSVNKGFSDPAGGSTGATYLTSVTITSNNANRITGLRSSAQTGASAFNLTGSEGLIGGVLDVLSNNTGTITNATGARGSVVNGSTGTITTAAGGQFYLENNNAAGVITNAYAVRAYINNNAGTYTNTYGVHVGDVTHGTQTNQAYSFYASDTNARNFFAGDTTIGSDLVVTDTLQVSGATTLAGQTDLGDSGTADRVLIKGGEFVDGGAIASSGTCGTSPSWAGGRNFWRVTAGTGAPTSCAVTFSTAFTASPTCTITVQGSAKFAYITALSTSAITFANNDGSSMEGLTYHVSCIGDG